MSHKVMEKWARDWMILQYYKNTQDKCSTRTMRYFNHNEAVECSVLVKCMGLVMDRFDLVLLYHLTAVCQEQRFHPFCSSVSQLSYP